MVKGIKDIEKEVKEQLSTEEGVLEFHRQMVKSCYNGLNKRDKLIYEVCAQYPLFQLRDTGTKK